MKKKRIQQQALVTSLLFLMVSSVSVVYADGFYTIIGPDGRPMVVPMKVAKKEPIPTQHQQIEQRPQAVLQTVPAAPSVTIPLERKKIDQSPLLESKQTQLNPVKQVEESKPVTLPQKQASRIEQVATPSESIKVSNQKTETIFVPAATQLSVPLTSSKVVIPEKSLAEKKSMPVEQVTRIPKASDTLNQNVSSAGFSQVDGIEYVNNEYLENQEFNLEGKKRFYSMPDGSGRMETIERKKGVSRSVLDKLLNRPQQSTTPIALSSTYVRLSSEDLKSAFENDRCFLEDYKKSVKTLALKKDVGLWPRKPLKDRFEYEVVKLDPSLQYMQIDSYASSQDKPTYYWPLVVFLDEKGCIEEGVSGFKNSTTAATAFQHSAIQGVIKVPKEARYMMMTPLASAVDVSEQELSNQGQIRISVLQ